MLVRDARLGLSKDVILEAIGMAKQTVVKETEPKMLDNYN